MLIRVDGERCDGHGLCQALAGRVYQIDEDTGVNEMGEFEIADTLRDEARRGAAACPERAIDVVE